MIDRMLRVSRQPVGERVPAALCVLSVPRKIFVLEVAQDGERAGPDGREDREWRLDRIMLVPERGMRRQRFSS